MPHYYPAKFLVTHNIYRNCPEKVMKALDAFSSRIMILKPLTDHNDPIMQLTYQPDLPSLSIRTITAAIASAKSPPFNVSIHHPTSLEELSRKQQILEQSRLLRRLIVAVVVAIPTFIISIVFMSLVKSSNQVKQYLMEPMWKGNVQRLDWALFFLATPVMFYCANMFHRKSIKELKGLWRRGSPTPIWRRFVRFGSMNLLVGVFSLCAIRRGDN
jgi:Cu+-exporting ATPase